MTNAVGRLPAMAFSPDGKLLAHIVRDGEIVARVWDVETGREVSAIKGLRPTPRDWGIRLPNHPDSDAEIDNFTGLFFTDGGKHIAVVGDRRIHVRDAVTGEPVAKYEVPAIPLPDSSERGGPRTDAPSGNRGPQDFGPAGPVKLVRATLLGFSPDGRLYVGNSGSAWQVGEVATQKVLFCATVKPPVNKDRKWQQPFAAISPDGKLAAFPSETLDEVGLWDIPGRRLVCTLADKARQVKLIDHLAFTADGRHIVAGGENIVYRWDVATRAALPPLEGNAGYGPPRSFSDSDCKTLVTVDDNGMVRRWEPTTGKQLEAPHGYAPYTMTDLSSDGAYAVIADDGGRIDLWMLGDGPRCELRAPGLPAPRDIRFSPTGRLLAAGFADGTIHVWDSATRRELKQFRADPTGRPSGVDGLAWSPDESCLYATTGLSGVLAWDWRAGRLRWQASTSQATTLRASTDGRLVAALRTDHREILILWADNGTVRATARLPADKDRFFAPHCIAFTPDGHTIAAGHYDGLLRLWDTATGKERAAFPSDGDVMWGIDVSRDGRHAVTGSSNGTVRVWELDTGKEVFRRAEPRSSSLRVTLSADGRSVLSAQRRAPLLWSLVAKSDGNRERLWNDLVSDPATAYRGQWGLADTDGLAVFLRAKVGGPIPRSEADRIGQLVADLDDNSFRAREAAQAELVRLGRMAEVTLRQALGRPRSAEQKGRLEALVARFDKEISPGDLRMRRAIQALSWSRDPAATTLINEWASGMAGAPLTELARTALQARDRRP
jgi:WD40 repeat protein